LQAKEAATRYQVTEAKQRVDQANLKIQSLEQKRSALVAPTDQSSAEARLHEAEAAAQSAEARIRMSIVKAPIAGTVYQFDLKPGAYLNAGDMVAAIGRLERVHVNVFVDEPDLGRVTKGMPVTITWDALPGRQWKGSVDRLPTRIVALGSRQVGEVVCVIENPNHDLLPGTNVSVLIQSERVENALTIPKEAVHRQQGQAGVYILEGTRLVWRSISQGISNTTRTQVSELKDGDVVALPTEKGLKDGHDRATGNPVKPLLVVYATREGQTRRIAEHLGATVRARAAMQPMSSTPRTYRPHSLWTLTAPRSSARRSIRAGMNGR
jgi:HlyD family secretion protein